MNSYFYYHFRKQRNVNGILLLDKPKGISSNNALQIVKHIYNANCAGFAGTLDPLATGMLPICFGKATKFSQYLVNSDKLYRVVAKLGQKTDTFDADGQVIEERLVNFDTKQLYMTLESFHNDIFQIPPMYSALKYKGKKLYTYARQGISLPRKARKVTIYKLLLIRYNNNELELEIHCSKGTYIRTIIDDLGEKLGCGAHVIYLRRLTIGKYLIKQMITFRQLNTIVKKAHKYSLAVDKLIDSLLIPINSPVLNYPSN